MVLTRMIVGRIHTSRFLWSMHRPLIVKNKMLWVFCVLQVMTRLMNKYMFALVPQRSVFVVLFRL